MTEETTLQVKEHILEIASFDPTIRKKKKQHQKYDQADDFVGDSVDKTGLLETDGVESSFLDLKKKKIPVMKEARKLACFGDLGKEVIETIYMRRMQRQPDHVMTFLLAERGTSGSLDGQQQLAVKDEYVLYTSCRSPDTILTKENHLFFLRCEQCGSGLSVVPIKAGFITRVGHRDTRT